MTDKEKVIKELKEILDSLDITNEHRLNLIRAIEYLQEEPVSKDLSEYINELSKQFPEVSFAKLSRIAVRVAKWQKQQIAKENMLLPFKEYDNLMDSINKKKKEGYEAGYKRGLIDAKNET